jgi:DNA repair protein RecO (recombination protein O)
MYKLFVSEGIVLGKRGFGEANAFTSILTKEFGLLRATARSARVEQSKLRYGLEPLTRARFTFVRGKAEWKLTGVQDVERPLLKSSREARAVSGRVSKLLQRLIHGEEPVSELFIAVDEGFAALARAGSGQEVRSIESVLVLRVLAGLGYLPHTPELQPFLEADFFSIGLAAEVERSKALLMRTINESLSASGL